MRTQLRLVLRGCDNHGSDSRLYSKRELRAESLSDAALVKPLIVQRDEYSRVLKKLSSAQKVSSSLSTSSARLWVSRRFRCR
jgi:hypothetical protein